MARKTFIDNARKQIVEQHLLRPLPNLLAPGIIAGYTDEDLRWIAAESKHTVMKRRHLFMLHKGPTSSWPRIVRFDLCAQDFLEFVKSHHCGAFGSFAEDETMHVAV